MAFGFILEMITKQKNETPLNIPNCKAVFGFEKYKSMDWAGRLELGTLASFPTWAAGPPGSE